MIIIWKLLAIFIYIYMSIALPVRNLLLIIIVMTMRRTMRAIDSRWLINFLRDWS